MNFSIVFNTAKLLAKDVPNTLDRSLLSAIPEDWLSELDDISRANMTRNFATGLFKWHVGSDSTYTYKETLIESLKIIYCFFKAKGCQPLSDEKLKRSVDLLTEGIEHCTAGFHERVNLVISELETPKNLAQLVHKVRENLVVKTTAHLMDLYRTRIAVRNQIHLSSQVKRVAAELNLGIIAFDDPYVALNDTTAIKEQLKKVFNENLTRINLPLLLIEEIKALLLCKDYSGFKQGGYNLGEMENFISIMGNFVPDMPKDPEFTEDFLGRYFVVENYIIQDINWRGIQQELFEALKEEGYYSSLEEIKEIIPQFIETADDFKWLIKNLTCDEIKKIKAADGFKKQLHELISTVDDFKWLIKNLTLEEITALGGFKEQLPQIIKDAYDFEKLIDDIEPEKRSVVLNALVEQLSRLANSDYKVKLIIGRLTPQEITALGRFRTLETVFGFDLIIRNLEPDKRNVVFNAFKEQLPRLLETVYNFECLIKILTPEEITAVAGFKEKLHQVIKTTYNFECVIRNLAHQKRSVVFNALKEQLSRLVKTIDDFNCIIENLTPVEIEEVIAVAGFKEKLDPIIKTAGDFAEVINEVEPEKRSAVFNVYKERLPRLVKTVADFECIIRNLTPVEIEEMIAVAGFKKELYQIIKTANDFKWENLTQEERTAVRNNAVWQELILLLDLEKLLSTVEKYSQQLDNKWITFSETKLESLALQRIVAAYKNNNEEFLSASYVKHMLDVVHNERENLANYRSGWLYSLIQFIERLFNFFISEDRDLASSTKKVKELETHLERIVRFNYANPTIISASLFREGTQSEESYNQSRSVARFLCSHG